MLDPAERKRELVTAVVVKRMEILGHDWSAVEGNEAPGIELVVDPCRIERLAYVRAFAYGDEALEVECELLPTQAQL